MRVIIDRVLPVALAIVFLAGVHGTEVVMAALPQPDSHDCGCSTECACRGPDNGCGCYSQELTMEARCGCGASGPQHEGMAPSWDTEFAPACLMGAPLLISSPAPDPGEATRPDGTRDSFWGVQRVGAYYGQPLTHPLAGVETVEEPGDAPVEAPTPKVVTQRTGTYHSSVNGDDLGRPGESR